MRLIDTQVDQIFKFWALHKCWTGYPECSLIHYTQQDIWCVWTSCHVTHTDRYTSITPHTQHWRGHSDCSFTHNTGEDIEIVASHTTLLKLSRMPHNCWQDGQSVSCTLVNFSSSTTLLSVQVSHATAGRTSWVRVHPIREPHRQFSIKM